MHAKLQECRRVELNTLNKTDNTAVNRTADGGIVFTDKVCPPHVHLSCPLQGEGKHILKKPNLHVQHPQLECQS